ncbi:beta-lactamase family protein [Pseudoalteromonas sp. NEC-BIFX-2020_015]|uniref:serine hydrolase domain-containing protein n=1 Tax=Pseudoalteromonas sp. NEC-BIFX-2020_015 TaxID=2729544 RepID=UPI0014616F4F|nr:serine hydrolase domain-containing protein [Pseudoalteromonas sp. NEC-BIFX-2020_015]NMR26888.1 beta-lactamase family protein [Pseudoalteromonas sp. NEC-BIFX-2020_015]
MYKSIQAIAGVLLLFSFAVMGSETQLTLLEKEIDRIAGESIPVNGPGCSVGVIKNQQFLFKKSYGLANIEHQVPLSSISVFRMASVSKQFTGLAVLLLAEKGEINLDDDIRKYLTDLKDYGVKVTINSMLGHVSGMADYDTLQSLLPKPLLSTAGGPFRLGDEDYLTREEYYDVIKSLPLEHQPDTQQAYSNFAYFLLSELVAKVSGMSMREYTTKYIFEPLGMHDTFFADDMREIVPNRAEGYRTFKDIGLKRYETNIFVVGDGGLYTTLEDMLIWDNHFYTPKLGDAPNKLMAQFNTPNSQHSFENNGITFYANGQYIEPNYTLHNGGWMGTSTSYIRRPKEQVAFVGMCNSSSLDANVFTYEIPKILTKLKIWDVTDPAIF